MHPRPYIPIPQYWPWVSCIYDKLAAFKLFCKISYMLDTLQKIFLIYLHFYHSRHDIFFICSHTVHIHSKYLKKESFGKSIYRQSKNSLKWFFFVSTVNRKGGVLCSARFSERLKMRKSLAVHYRQNKPFLVLSSIVIS